MQDRDLLVTAGVLAILLGVALTYPAPVWEQVKMPGQNADEQEPNRAPPHVGEPGSAHDHGYLFFLVNGTRKPMTDPYILQSAYVHFHGDDDILHVEATNVTLNFTLRTLDIGVNQSCIRFGPDKETYCNDADTVLRAVINGEETPIPDALRYRPAQDDTIILFHGDRATTIPDQYLEKRLPDNYRNTENGYEL